MFAFIDLAVKVVAGSIWLTSRAIYGTSRFAWRWPFTFLLICALFFGGCYAMAGQPT